MSWYRGPVYDTLGLDGRSHRTALWCFRMVWLQPTRLSVFLKTIPPRKRLSASLLIMAHCLPYIIPIFLAEFGSFHMWLPSVFSVRDLNTTLSLRQINSFWGLTGEIVPAINLAVELGFLCAAGNLIFSADRMIPAKQRSWIGGMALVSFLIGAVLAMSGVQFAHLFTGLLTAAGCGISAAIVLGGGAAAPLALLGAFAGPMLWGIHCGPLTQLQIGVIMAMVIGLAGLHGVNVLLHPFFLWPKVRGDWYFFHPIAWDEMVPWEMMPGTRRLLVDFARRSPQRAAVEFERLQAIYPDNWWGLEKILTEVCEKKPIG